MIFRRARIAVLAFAGFVASSSVAWSETLADALAYGYEHSGLLEQNRALLRAADEDVAQAYGLLLPVVTWSGDVTATFPRVSGNDLISANLTVNAELLLYDGGATRLAVEAQKETVLATRQSLLSVEQDVLFRIVEAYLNLRRSMEFVALRQNNVRLITQELRAARDRFEVGDVTRTDVSLAEARLAAARSQLAADEGTLAQAVAEYRAAVGRAPGNVVPAAPARAPWSLVQAQDLAVRTHPAIRESQHTAAATDLNVARAEALMRPTVDLVARLGLDNDGNRAGQVGINASGPIYQGGRLSSQVRQFMARRDAARAGLHLTVDAVRQNVTIAYTSIEVARASRDASERQVRASTVAFNGVREEATLGQRTTLDVLNAEQELLLARANLISAQIDETIASYRLLAAIGLLTAEHLGLNVRVYDPAAYYNLVRTAPAATSEQGRALERVLEAIGD